MKHFFIIILLSYIAGHAYLGLRGFQAFSGYPLIQKLLIACIILLASSFFVGMFMGRGSGTGLPVILYHVSMVWLVPFLYLVIFALFTDILRLSDAVVMWFPPFVRSIKAFPLYWMLSGMALVGIICTWGYLRFNNPSVTKLSLEVSEDRVSADNVSDTMQGMRIVMASDIHLGRSVGAGRLEKYVSFINSLNPDLVLLGGDILDHGIRGLDKDGIYAAISKINARYGVYGVPGNHEYYGGMPESVEWLESAGIIMLRDSVVNIGDLISIAGRDDRSAHRRKPLKDIVKGLSEDIPVIVLDHQPYSFDESELCGVFFHFSGHTHYGQVWPASLITKRMYDVAYGYKKKGKTHFYVSSGLALWGPPYRIGTQSEVLLLELQGFRR